jgi:hypothetical protein
LWFSLLIRRPAFSQIKKTDSGGRIPLFDAFFCFDEEVKDNRIVNPPFQQWLLLSLGHNTTRVERAGCGCALRCAARPALARTMACSISS